MTRRTKWAVVTAAVLAAVGLAIMLLNRGHPVPHLPDNPDEVVVFSLDPTKRRIKDDDGNPVEPAGERFHNVAVLGSAAAETADQKQQITTSLLNAIRNGPSQAARCFEPRHAIRVVKGSEIVEVVVCFEYWRYRVYRNGTNESAQYEHTINGGYQEVFDKFLLNRGVPLAPKPSTH